MPLVKPLFVLALTGLAAAGPAHAANLVTNGSFDAQAITLKERFLNNVTGWTGGANLTYLDAPGTADDGNYLSVYKGFPATSPDGGNFVEADGDPGNVFSQTISGLTPGTAYTVSFYQAAGQQLNYTGPTTERWRVSLGGASQLSAQFKLPQGATGPWQAQSLTFVADATSDVLSFLAVGTPGGAPPISFLDGVNLDAASQSVPEPATVAVVGLALAGLGVARRRR